MDILFSSRRLRKICNNFKTCVKEWGAESAKILRKTLDELQDAENLSIFMNLPRVQSSRCHQLKGNKKGMFAIDLKHPYRLIFKPANDPLPRTADGGIDRNKVTIVKIVKREDYHGK